MVSQTPGKFSRLVNRGPCHEQFCRRIGNSHSATKASRAGRRAGNGPARASPAATNLHASKRCRFVIGRKLSPPGLAAPPRNHRCREKFGLTLGEALRFITAAYGNTRGIFDHCRALGLGNLVGLQPRFRRILNCAFPGLPIGEACPTFREYENSSAANPPGGKPAARGGGRCGLFGVGGGRDEVGRPFALSPGGRRFRRRTFCDWSIMGGCGDGLRGHSRPFCANHPSGQFCGSKRAGWKGMG